MRDGDDIFGGRSREQVLADAAACGVDLTLIDAQLRRTPEERLRVLSDDVEFLRELRYNPSRAVAPGPGGTTPPCA